MSERAFDKFTKRAKQVLQIATEEARAFNHPYIGTEHILLGHANVEETFGVFLLERRYTGSRVDIGNDEVNAPVILIEVVERL